MVNKPRVKTKCVANGYAAPNERIIEFTGQKGSGGLIAFRNTPDGRLSVHVYNTTNTDAFTHPAAPDLLAALDDLMRAAHEAGGKMAFGPEMDAARAAIGKAKGKAPSAAGRGQTVNRYKCAYSCPDCGTAWKEEWCCLVDCDCPSCEATCEAADDSEVVATYDLAPGEKCPVCHALHITVA